VEALDVYTSLLAVLSAAALLVAAGLAKKQLDWKRPVPARVRRRRAWTAFAKRSGESG
jgi:hypothetical protein